MPSDDDDIITGRVPAFEIRNSNQELLIYASGQVDGLVANFGGGTIFNRIPTLIAQAEERGYRRGRALSFVAAFSTGAGAAIAMDIARWLVGLAL